MISHGYLLGKKVALCLDSCHTISVRLRRTILVAARRWRGPKGWVMSDADDEFCRALDAGNIATAKAVLVGVVSAHESMQTDEDPNFDNAIKHLEDWLMQCGCIERVTRSSGLLKSYPPAKVAHADHQVPWSGPNISPEATSWKPNGNRRIRGLMQSWRLVGSCQSSDRHRWSNRDP
jgi:hypothetical protein